MNLFHRISKSPIGWVPALLATFLVGCGGGLDPILGTPVAGMAPTVNMTSPVASGPVVTGVLTNSRVSATFSKAMTPASITNTSFTLACPTGTPVAATVALDATGKTALLTPDALLPTNTLCVATITTAATDSAGLALASNFVWSFMTAAATDATRPMVTITVPGKGATNVATNTQISATFGEAMIASTLSDSSFTVANTTLGTAVTGTVSYSVASKTATFKPTGSSLATNTDFTATISTAATDLSGNALAGTTAALPAASNYVWSFKTGSVSDAIAPTVLSISPLADASNICLTKIVSATFSEPMDASTITASTFKVEDNGVAVSGTVAYDALTQQATFTPSSAAGFATGKTFVVTITSGATGVKDLAGNPLAADRSWNFSTGTQACPSGVNLGTAAGFGAFGGAAGVTNQGINTVVAGDIGTTAACTLVTGFHDATNVYSQTPLNVGVVNGTISCAPPAPGTATSMAAATQARADALSAYNALAAMPAGSDPGAGQLGGLVLPAAVYTAAGGTFAITSGDLTLDAQGDANAVWVFQSASALTVGLGATPRHVLLINGAQAKNVFWQVGSAARIEDGSAMVGTIIAPAGVTISTAGQTIQTTLTGRALGLTASVTMVNTTVVAP